MNANKDFKMSPDLTERELDELLAMYQDHPAWHSDKLVPAIPYLIQELRRRRGTSGPTHERDRRIDYKRVQRAVKNSRN